MQLKTFYPRAQSRQLPIECMRRGDTRSISMPSRVIQIGLARSSFDITKTMADAD